MRTTTTGRGSGLAPRLATMVMLPWVMAGLLIHRAVTRLDHAIEDRGGDPEAGISTTEYVILGALVLTVAVAVIATFTGAMEGWADRIPTP